MDANKSLGGRDGANRVTRDNWWWPQTGWLMWICCICSAAWGALPSRLLLSPTRSSSCATIFTASLAPELQADFWPLVSLVCTDELDIVWAPNADPQTKFRLVTKTLNLWNKLYISVIRIIYVFGAFLAWKLLCTGEPHRWAAWLIIKKQ